MLVRQDLDNDFSNDRNRWRQIQSHYIPEAALEAYFLLQLSKLFMILSGHWTFGNLILETDLWPQDNLHHHFPSSTKLCYYNTQIPWNTDVHFPLLSWRLIARVFWEKEGEQDPIFPCSFCILSSWKCLSQNPMQWSNSPFFSACLSQLHHLLAELKLGLSEWGKNKCS